MGGEALKINGIRNNSMKRIAEDAQSEHLPLQKRIKISSSNETADLIRRKPLSFDEISNIPGLQHISEDILKLLDKKSLMDCRLVNSSWKNILNQPMFWMNKMKFEKLVPLDVQKSLKALVKQLEIEQIAKSEAKDWLQKFNSTILPLDYQNKWRGWAEELEDDQIPKTFLLVLMKICQKQQIESCLEIVMKLQKVKKFPELINFILENEDINSKVNFVENDDEWKGITPIHLAACYGLTRTVEKLLVKYDSSNIQTDVDGDTPITCAAFFGHLETVKFLAGFTDLSAPDKHGQTPIFLATWKGHLEIVKFLAPRVKHPNTPNAFGETPLFTAAEEGHEQIVEYMSKITEDPNAQNPNGATPLFIAASKGHINIVKYLSKFTENPNAPDLNGTTPLFIAAAEGHTQVVEYLSQFTINPNASHPANGRTPLLVAAAWGHTEIVILLSQFTDDPNEPDQNGETPLFIAAREGHAQIVEYLSKFTDNPNAPNLNGVTPLQIATSHGHTQIVKYLSKFK